MVTLIDSTRRGSNAEPSPLQAADQHARRRASLVAALREHTAQLTQHEDIVQALTASRPEAANAEVAVTMSLADGLRDTIDEITAALERLDSGTYGNCESCGNTIPTARLDAIPHARVCVSCPRQRSPIRPNRR
jgi:DnaK suppressor protein